MENFGVERPEIVPDYFAIFRPTQRSAVAIHVMGLSSGECNKVTGLWLILQPNYLQTYGSRTGCRWVGFTSAINIG